MSWPKILWMWSREKEKDKDRHLPGDPRKSDELVFWITSKVVKIEPSYWMEKMQNFIRIISISMIWKSDHWSLHHVFISKSGQNAKQSGISLFSNYICGLLSENVHITAKMNGLNPNVIPHMNAIELWNAYLSHM